MRSERAGRCKKHLAFLNPEYPDYRYENVLMHRLAALARDLRRPKASRTSSSARRVGSSSGSRSWHSESFASRGSIRTQSLLTRPATPVDERREIEAGLKGGTKLVVFSTNALEVGIDMGRLDMVTMVGFPETVMSAWQRAGRAGRSLDKEALVLFLASRNAIDQFYVENIDLFVDKPLDRLAVNLENEEILDPHALCALFEAERRQVGHEPGHPRRHARGTRRTSSIPT